jgi:hypothetical protein
MPELKEHQESIVNTGIMLSYLEHPCILTCAAGINHILYLRKNRKGFKEEKRTRYRDNPTEKRSILAAY